MSGNFAAWLLALETQTPMDFDAGVRQSNESELSATYSRRLSAESPVKTNSHRRGSVPIDPLRI